MFKFNIKQLYICKCALNAAYLPGSVGTVTGTVKHNCIVNKH